MDFYITFPYYQTKEYHCGILNIPKDVYGLEKFDAVENGISSNNPVKFSYHRDGNVHFKDTDIERSKKKKSYKLANIQATPLIELEGNHIFTISFEGLDKFQDLKNHRTREGDEEVVLPIPESIKRCKILAYAGPSESSITNKIGIKTPPWFVTKAVIAKQEVYIGVYAILHKQSHIEDDNKNALTVFVGFDPKKSNVGEDAKCLYLFAR